MLEQALCLLGSANYQISVLRRKKECYLGMTFHPLPRNRLTCHVAFLKISRQMQGAKFLALPNVGDPGQSPCGAPLTLGLLPLQSTLRTVQKNAFFVLKGRSNKNQPAPTSVGANNVRSRGVKYCKGFSNRFSFNPSSVLPSCHKGKFFRNPADRCRGPGIVKERSYSGRQSLRPGLLQRSISCSQERGHLLARDRVEFIKAFCSPRSFSDRGAPFFKDPSKERGLHDKYRSKRHIFFRSNSQILSKVSWFHLGHKTLHLSGSPFRSQLSTPNIHQAPETCSRLPEEAGVSHNNLFRRRPSSSCLLQRGNIASNLNVVKSITVPGLSHKLDEINTVPRSVNNIPRFCHKLCEYDHLLIRGQSSKGLCSLQQLSLSQPQMSGRQLASLLGTLESCRLAIWVAPFHLRALQILLIQTLRNHQFDYNCPVFLNLKSRAELTWWLNNLPKVNGNPVSPPPQDLTILSNALMQGWGATCQGKTTNGKWSSQESIQHINLLELKAAFLGLKTFLKNQSHKVVLVTLDNSMAVAYLNNKGGTHSVPLMSLALEIWTWCLQRNVLISAQHVPAKENTIADLESRTFLDSTDWQLDPTVISAFLTNCNTDLFASRLTAQLPQYVSWRPDPGAFHIDALTLHWKSLMGYASPRPPPPPPLPSI